MSFVAEAAYQGGFAREYRPAVGMRRSRDSIPASLDRGMTLQELVVRG